MIDKKKILLIILIIITVIIAIVAVSLLYAVFTLSPIFVSYGQPQLADRSYEEGVSLYPLIVIGEITNVKGVVQTVKPFLTTVLEGDYIRFTEPKSEITIKIDEVLKNKINYTDDTIVVYDDAVLSVYFHGEIKVLDSKYTVKHNVGDRGLFLIGHDEYWYMYGFGDYYPIIDGITTISKKYDIFLNPIRLEDNLPIVPPMELEEAKKIARAG